MVNIVVIIEQQYEDNDLNKKENTPINCESSDILEKIVDVTEKITIVDNNYENINFVSFGEKNNILANTYLAKRLKKGIELHYYDIVPENLGDDVKLVKYKSQEKMLKKIYHICDVLIVFSSLPNNEIEKLDIWNKTRNIDKFHFNVNDKLNSNFDNKLNLITNNLKEIIDIKQLKYILRKRNLKIYWGVTPTGICSLAYSFPLLKIAELVDAECEVTILIADIHAYLDNKKTSFDKTKARSKYYIEMIKSVLELYNVDFKYIKFVMGSDFQLNKDYTLDFYKLSGLVTIEAVKDASSEVVKINDNPILSNIQYCILQSLDEQYLECDGQLGGIDQRKINIFAIENMHKIGHKTKFYLMNYIISGLSFSKNESGELKKMSSSDVNSKIDLNENENSIRKKINKAYCVDGDSKDNSILQLIKNLAFKILSRSNKKFQINRLEKYGGFIEYDNYEDLEYDFENNKVCSSDIKLGLSDFIINFLKPVREKFNSEEMASLSKEAY